MSDPRRPNSRITETTPLLPDANGTTDGDTESANQHQEYSRETEVSTDIAMINDTNDNALGPQPRQEDLAAHHEGLPDLKERLPHILPAVAIGIFLAAADQTITVTSYARIGTELHALSSTSWIATAYFLTLTAFQPLYGKLSDIFGRKACLLFAYVVFGAGSLGCGLARDMRQLVAARALAGVGAGGMTTVVSILLTDIVTMRERGKWQGYLNVIAALGSTSGGPMGGILADSVGWRWAFLGQVPLCILAFVAVFFVLHMPQTEESDWRKDFARIDFIGAATLIAAVSTILFALDRGGNVGWRSPTALIGLGVSIPLFAMFILVETKVAKEPFAPGQILFHRSLAAGYICFFFCMASYMAALFYIPLYFQAVEGISATGAGLRLIPNLVCSIVGSLLGGWYMQRYGRYYYLSAFSYLGMVLAMAIVVLSSRVVISSSSIMIVGLSLAGLLMGIGTTTTLIGLIANVAPEDQAVVNACSYLFRSLGSVFGISMSATVANQALRNSLAHELPQLGLSAEKAHEIARMVREDLGYLDQLRPSVRAVATECYAHGTAAAFVLQLAMTVGCAVSAWFVEEKVLSK